MFDLETNEHVQKAIDERQMPKTEYRKINIEDYSKCSLSPLKGKAGHLLCMGGSPTQSRPDSWKSLPTSPQGSLGLGSGAAPCTELAGRMV